MNLAKSSFYYKARAKSSDQMKVEADLRDRIQAVRIEYIEGESSKIPGSPQVLPMWSASTAC